MFCVQIVQLTQTPVLTADGLLISFLALRCTHRSDKQSPCCAVAECHGFILHRRQKMRKSYSGHFEGILMSSYLFCLDQMSSWKVAGDELQNWSQTGREIWLSLHNCISGNVFSWYETLIWPRQLKMPNSHSSTLVLKEQSSANLAVLFLRYIYSIFVRRPHSPIVLQMWKNW